MIRITYPVKCHGILWPNVHQYSNKVLVELLVYSKNSLLNCIKVLFFFAFLENEKIENQDYEKRNDTDQKDQPAGLEAHVG